VGPRMAPMSIATKLCPDLLEGDHSDRLLTSSNIPNSHDVLLPREEALPTVLSQEGKQPSLGPESNGRGLFIDFLRQFLCR
jgi:hypothetical protein